MGAVLGSARSPAFSQGLGGKPLGLGPPPASLALQKRELGSQVTLRGWQEPRPSTSKGREPSKGTGVDEEWGGLT